MVLVCIFAECADKGVSRVVEDVEEAFMERQSCTEYGSDDNIIGRQVYPGYA